MECTTLSNIPNNEFQYIKILMCVCPYVCVMEVGCLWGGTRLVTRDLRTSTRTLQRMLRTLGMVWNSWGYERMQSGSSSRSECNRGAAVEADAIGEQQLKWTQSGSSS